MSTFLLGIALFINLFYIAITLFGLDTWLGIRVGNYNGELGVLLVVSFIISLYIFFKEKQKHVNSFKIFSLIVITLSVGTFGWFSFLNILGLFMEF